VRVALLQPRADIVHAHDLETLPAGLLVSRSTTLIYDAHELYADWEGATHGFYRRYCRWIEGAAASRAKAFVTVSDGIADTLAARYEGSQPIVVLNTPDVAFRPRPAGIPDGKVRVIYQGIFTAGRGIETLLDAARLLPECEISIRGFGPLEDEFRALAREAHAAVLPAVSPDRILEGLDGFHIGVVPYEPRTLNNVLCLPNKLFEYMAAGLAIVAADLPELRRVISDTGAGTTFTPGDPVSLAEAIRVLADPTRLATAQERAATAADGEYSWRHQRTVLQQLYRELCAAS
jgi:glycosyltransferase involved in cell wall biosynthesis